MSLSTYNDTNQHWIPRFLLKGFGKKNQASSIYRLDCATSNIDTVQVEKIVSRVGLLTVQDDEQLRGIENNTRTVIDDIRKNRLSSVGPADRRALDELVMALAINNPGFQKASILDDIARERLQLLTRAVADGGGLIDRQSTYDTLDGYISRNFLLEHRRHGQRSVTRLLFRTMCLSVRRPPEGESFVIGDYPVVEATSQSIAYRTAPYGILKIMLPIRHDCLLVYDWASQDNIIDAGPPVSMRVLRWLDDFYRNDPRCPYIYGRTSESLKRSAMLNFNWPEPAPSRELKQRWRSVRSEIQDIEKLERERKGARGSVMYLAAKSLPQSADGLPANPLKPRGE